MTAEQGCIGCVVDGRDHTCGYVPTFHWPSAGDHAGGDHRVIDFRKKSWGHDLTIKTTTPDHLSGFCWSTPGPHKGDHLIWATEYGYATGEVAKSEWTINVDDMFAIEVRVIRRSSNDGSVLWEANDRLVADAPQA